LTPLVAALRDAGHELGIVLSTRNAEAFARGVFAERITLERIPWPKHGSTPETYRPAVTRARKGGYQIALIASEEPEAYRLAREAGIPRRIGFWNAWGRPLKSLWIRAMCTGVRFRCASAQRAEQHEVETLFTLGSELHDEPGPTRDVARLAPLVVSDLPRARVGRGLQLNPKWERLLDRPALEALCRELAATGPLRIFVSAAERAAFSNLELAGGELMVFDALGEWKRAIAEVNVLITPDTGAAHVAGMLGTPTVDCFPDPATLPRDAARWHPWAAPYRALAPDGDLRAAIVTAVRELEGAQ
jgi:ADP-heptose:LPS heptosyltransferase